MIQSVRGTKDNLPGQIENWHFIEEIFRKVSASFGYQELRTPIFEKTEVFSRSIGDGTDIVNKEMYTFDDKGGESITLRPEMTAALVRSVIQNSIIQPSQTFRAWYFGPFFRYERPQKGRLRQFHQYGAECLGSANPTADAEIIQLADALIKSSGIKKYDLMINSLGNEKSRVKYRNALVSFLKNNIDALSEDSKNRIDQNPLRVLDSKDEKDRLILKNAPDIIDHLDEESKAHFDKVKDILTFIGIDFTIDRSLVRGLDYYSHTVFEFRSDALGAQDSFGGGGRYDGLFAQLGGKETPAVGFAFGVERMLMVLESEGILNDIFNLPDLYLVCADVSIYALIQKLANQIREAGYSVYTDLQNKSVKAQMREANKLNSRFVAIIGENEVRENKVSIKKMDTGEETEFILNKLQEYNFS